MPNHNPTRTNYLTNSVDFNPGEFLSLSHGADVDIEFAHIPVFPTEFNFTGGFAIEAWVNPSSEALIRSRIVQTPEVLTEGVTVAFMLGLLGDKDFYGTDNNALRIGMDVFTDGVGLPTQVTCDPVLKRDTWHHIIGQWNGDENQEIGSAITIYVDGCKRDTIDYPALDYSLDTANTVDPTGLVVGWDANLDAPFKGAMASLALFDRLLTDDEIETLAQGISNLIAPKSVLKPNVVAWWKMGDGDPADLSQLLDSVGTNHLTTVNMVSNNLLTSVPKERPRKHQCAHATTFGDELKVDPNSFGTPFLWDSFNVVDIITAFPHGWFGNRDSDDTFTRINIPGRLSVFSMHKECDGEGDQVLFITNISSISNGSTLLFDNPRGPDSTEYCMEFVARSRVNTADGIHYIGWINDPHGYIDPALEPQDGVFIRWDTNANEISLVVSDIGDTSIDTFSANDDQFYKIKLTFKYFHDENGNNHLKASMHINDTLEGELDVDGSEGQDDSYPNGSADIFIGTSIRGSPESGENYDFDISYIAVTHRGLGHDILDPVAP